MTDLVRRDAMLDRALARTDPWDIAIIGGGATGVVHCAIYTRKSTDEGLDRDFNSLDAQREAAEAYVASQASPKALARLSKSAMLARKACDSLSPLVSSM